MAIGSLHAGSEQLKYGPLMAYSYDCICLHNQVQRVSPRMCLCYADILSVTELVGPFLQV